MDLRGNRGMKNVRLLGSVEISEKSFALLHGQRRGEVKVRHFRIELELTDGREDEVLCRGEVRRRESVAHLQVVAFSDDDVDLALGRLEIDENLVMLLQKP
jgi:hypothetical protein